MAEKDSKKEYKPKKKPYRTKGAMINQYIDICINCPYKECSDTCYKQMMKGERRDG